MRNASGQAKAQALRAMARLLETQKEALQAENAKDLIAAEKNGLEPALLDRLTLSDKALATMAAGVRPLAALHDPFGSRTARRPRPTRMRVAQMRENGRASGRDGEGKTR